MLMQYPNGRVFYTVGVMGQVVEKGCITVVQMDGAHMKHRKYNGCLFVLEGSDGDGKNVILAVALAPKENGENYDWFVGNCKLSGLGGWLGRQGQAVITDRHKGIPAAVSTYLPNCMQINCMRHIIINMRTTCGAFNESEVWALRGSATKELFEKKLAALSRKSPRAADYLSKVPVFKWVLYAVNVALYGHRTSNRVESENSRLKPSRFEDPYGFLEKSLFVIMDILRTNRLSAEKYVKEKKFLTPYAQKIYDLNDRQSQATEVRVATNNVCYVTYKAAQSETRRYLHSTAGDSTTAAYDTAALTTAALNTATALTIAAADTTAVAAAAAQIIAAAMLPLPTPLLPCCRCRPCP